ncbi:MAG: phosphonate metabolism transcriptional regulator PhnF [Pseudomonadota bacterium]
MTEPLWIQIRDALSREIADGRFGQGMRLPTEADLSHRFGVNRHTVRRALAAMKEAGLVTARRGSGVYVTGHAIPYKLGRRSRFTRNLHDGGHPGTRQILRLETIPCTAEERSVLGLSVTEPVHVLEAVGIISDVPVFYGQSVLPSAGLERFPAAMSETLSITAALKACGIDDYQRDWTRLTVESAAGTMAGHLMIAEGAPLLRSVSLNRTNNRPIEFSRTWFCADRIELVVET